MKQVKTQKQKVLTPKKAKSSASWPESLSQKPACAEATMAKTTHTEKIFYIIMNKIRNSK
jgi:hypothetical protein